MKTRELHRRIRSATKTDAFYDVLVNQSVAKSGPFDGGCLIVAEAFMQVWPDAKLVRIVSADDCTQHYGVKRNDRWIDASGAYLSFHEWACVFAEAEGLDGDLERKEGHDPACPAPSDSDASAKLASMIRSALL